jgi:hypothetical protein
MSSILGSRIFIARLIDAQPSPWANISKFVSEDQYAELPRDTEEQWLIVHPLRSLE